MKQEDRKLLLQDLCSRLPYHTFVKVNIGNKEYIGVILQLNDMGSATITYDNTGGIYNWDGGCDAYGVMIEDYKPYLRPMCSMTEEEIKELLNIDTERLIFSSRHLTWRLDGKVVDYLNSHHLDYRGLIEKESALPAPDGMYEIKDK